MSNENEKLAKARKKEEYGRIAKLVELAKANDRRFEAAKNSKKNAKAAARQAKVDAKAAEAAAADSSPTVVSTPIIVEGGRCVCGLGTYVGVGVASGGAPTSNQCRGSYSVGPTNIVSVALI
jgi:hypothetical protein